MASSRFPAVLAFAGTALVAGLLISRKKKISFRDKVVVIVGGSRGLGLAMARKLSAEGALMHLLARDAEELERAAESCPGSARGPNTWVCDVCDPGQLKATIFDIRREAGAIDMLINNAGVILVAPFETLWDEDFDEAMRTHFWAPYHAIRAALPSLRKSRGRIVNIASIGGKIAVPHLAAYSSSKFALVGLSSSLRSELALEGVSVTTVCPGLMRTGSHINAEFKGDCKKEFAWFSLGATLPVVSMDASRAAEKIISAARQGKAEIVLTPQARWAEISRALAPNFVAGMLAFAARFLPKSSSVARHKGKECSSAISPSVLTGLGDAASKELNQLPRVSVVPRS